MRTAPDDAGRRAERLLRWYPTSWRARYGDEFAELLSAEFSENPTSWSRSANVMWSGVVARMTGAGLTDHHLEPSDQVVTSLASLGWALGVFLLFGAAMLAQLTIGWQWAAPDTVGTTTAMVVMSGGMLLILVLALLATVPIASSVLLRAARRQAHGLEWPSLLFLLSAVVLVAGGRHFGNGWPGTGGHHWAHQGIVPGGVAAFLWASTLSISSYWAHPGALLSFPAAEVAWMVVSPVAIVGVGVGATKVVRRLELPPRVLRYEARLGRGAAVAMTAFLVGAGCWVVDGGPGPRNLFHSGAIDIAGVVAMTGALLVACRAAGNARRGGMRIVTTR